MTLRKLTAKEAELFSHGWDENHYEYQCSDGKHPSFWKTIVESKQWQAWSEEQSRRMTTHKPDARDGALFDTDESRECNWFSQGHFQEFLKFVIEQYEK